VSDRTGEGQYRPEPPDPSAVRLPESLKQLVEILAEHVHDTWAATRIEMGWSYGPKIDDVRKEHPCLVPYTKLPEADKDIDRNVVIGILSRVLDLGYELAPPPVTDQP